MLRLNIRYLLLRNFYNNLPASFSKHKFAAARNDAYPAKSGKRVAERSRIFDTA